jgi:hypothetical protein
MGMTRDIVRNPVCPDLVNNLEARRHKLKLSRVALAPQPRCRSGHRISPGAAGVVPLWHYAMRGVESENAEAEKLIKRFDRNGAPNADKLSPERYHRKGQRMIAHRLSE